MCPIDYDEQQWAEVAGHFPLRDRPDADFLLLHRHWMWANQQREAFDRYLGEGTNDLKEMGAAMVASRQIGFMLVWYAMLWAVTAGGAYIAHSAMCAGAVVRHCRARRAVPLRLFLRLFGAADDGRAFGAARDNDGSALHAEIPHLDIELLLHEFGEGVFTRLKRLGEREFE